jgi:hypothetical protein
MVLGCKGRKKQGGKEREQGGKSREQEQGAGWRKKGADDLQPQEFA